MRHILPVTLASVALLIVTGCSSTHVRTDWDPEVDFGRYHSFAFFERASGPAPRGPELSPLVARRIEQAVVDELSAIGFEDGPVRGADFLVTYQTAVRERVRVHHTGYAYPGHWYYGWGWGATHVSTYREGTLVVDVIDARQRALVWRGVAEGAFTKPDPDYAAIRKVVGRLLHDFPPAPR